MLPASPPTSTASTADAETPHAPDQLVVAALRVGLAARVHRRVKLRRTAGAQVIVVGVEAVVAAWLRARGLIAVRVAAASLGACRRWAHALARELDEDLPPAWQEIQGASQLTAQD